MQHRRIKNLFAWLAFHFASILLGCGNTHQDGAGSLAPDAATPNDSDVLPDGRGDAATQDANPPDVPALQPIGREKAVALARYARRLQFSTSNAPAPRPAGWSMVNVGCQDRAMALQYGLAAGCLPKQSPTPILYQHDSSPEAFLELAQSAEADRSVASISIAGPLATTQTLILPDETQTQLRGDTYFWSYHHGAVVNVDNELSVIDLSTGDEPLPVDAWAHSFVDPSTPCYAMEQPEFEKVWVYWLGAFANLVPTKRPERLCGYLVSPIFTLAGTGQPQLGPIATVTESMMVQLESLQTTLANLGASLPEDQLPMVLSRYTPLTEAEICERWQLQYCDELTTGGP